MEARLRNWHIDDWRAGKVDHIPASLHAKLEAQFGKAGSSIKKVVTKENEPVIKRRKDESN